MARAHASVLKAVTARISDYGLTPSQFAVLEALHHLGPLPLGELAEKLLVTGGNITYVVDRLEQQELVARVRRTDDRRVVHAALQPAGQRLMREIFPDHAQFIEHLFAALSATEQEELRTLLKKLGTSMRGQAGSAKAWLPSG